MLKKLITTGSVFSLSIALVTGAHAAVSAQEANKLGNSLTPFGAIKEGNGAEIPAWTGGITRGDIPSSYKRPGQHQDRKSTRLNSSHVAISYAVFCLKKKNKQRRRD